MNILFLSHASACPPDNGGKLRIHHLLEALLSAHEVTFAFLEGTGEAGEGWDLAGRLRELPIPLPRGPRPWVAGAWAPWWGWPESMRTFRAEAIWSRIAALPLESYDAVQVETLALAPFALAIRAGHPRVRLVIDTQDIASYTRRRELGRAFREENLRWYSRWRVPGLIDLARLGLIERRVLRRCDEVLVCSEVDARRVAALAGRRDARVVINGVDTAAHETIDAGANPPRLAYVGSMYYPPNTQAVGYFCAEVLPRIRQRVPGVEFWAIGSNPTEAIRRLHDPAAGVHVTGTVPDVRPLLSGCAASVVPLLVGGGTRLKILEAMAAGIPVVSTTVGAEGIEVRDGRDIFLADDPDAFASRCADLLEDPALRRRLAEAGRLTVKRYDWSVAGRQLLEVYERLDRAEPGSRRAGAGADRGGAFAEGQATADSLAGAERPTP